MNGGSEGRVHQTRNGTMKGEIGGGEVEEAKGGSQSRARGIRRQTRNYYSRKVNRRTMGVRDGGATQMNHI